MNFTIYEQISYIYHCILSNMRETSFIDQNKKKWQTFEDNYEREQDPEKVSNLFIQITDDLSYARTYYPNRSVKIYLNNLAQRVFQNIYRNKVRRRQKFASFWKDELPQKMFEARWQLLFTFALFMLAFFIGMFSSMHDSNFARFILGDTYVNMTEENIRSGDPMKVYKEMNQIDMFLAITVNNLQVAFITMIFGIFFGLGTVYFILYNGVMIGVFQYFFIERGLFQESFLTIWVHGALEVSAIVIAGTAGITLGKGLLFPGTLTRLQSFRVHGMRAVQIFMGIAPIIVLAAINESFLTRYTETPDLIRALLIAIEFGFMIYYFVVYPIKKSRAGFDVKRKSDEIPPNREFSISLSQVKNNGQVFSDSFLVFRQFMGPIIRTVSLVGILYVTVLFFFVVNFEDVVHNIQIIRAMAIFEAIKDIKSLLMYGNIGSTAENNNGMVLSGGLVLFIANTISLTIITGMALFIVRSVRDKIFTYSRTAFFKFMLRNGWIILICSIALHCIMLLNLTISRFIFILAVPSIMLIIGQIAQRDGAGFAVFSKSGYFFRNIVQVMLLYIPLLLLSIMIVCLSHSLLCFFNVELLAWNVPFSPIIYEAIQDISITLFLIITLFMMIGMIAINMILMYFSINEIESAGALQQRILTLKKTKKEFSKA